MALISSLISVAVKDDVQQSPAIAEMNLITASKLLLVNDNSLFIWMPLKNAISSVASSLDLKGICLVESDFRRYAFRRKTVASRMDTLLPFRSPLKTLITSSQDLAHEI